MDESEWLAGLQVGDKVHVMARGEIASAGEVIRATKTQFLVSWGQIEPARFNRTSGREMGGSDVWNMRRIQPYSEEVEQKRQVENERRIIHRRLQQVFASSRVTLPLEVLREIESIVKRHAEQVGENS